MASARTRRWISGCHFDLHIVQQDRLQRATAGDFEQRLKVIIRDTATKADVSLDCRTAEMAIENCLGGLKPDALVLAVQQLAEAHYGARG